MWLGLAAVPVATAQSIELSIEHFGVGDHVRPGDLIGIRLSLGAAVETTTEVEVVWELPDGNGDLAHVSRNVVLSPGETERTWLYARIPPRIPASTILSEVMIVRLFEIRDGARVGSLGSARFAPDTSVNPTVAVDVDADLIGIIGNGRMGLDVYATPLPGTNTIPSMNAITHIARGITAEDLPDSWQGLAPFETLVWTQESPQSLSGDVAKALRDWIFRGGHLVIVLPEAAEPWGMVSESKHPLSDLMPRWKVERVESVPVRHLLPILSTSDQLLNSRAAVPLLVFREPGADTAYEPLVLLPTPRDSRTGLPAPRADSLDGAVIGVQRSYGHGRMTVLGLDVDALNRRSLQSGPFPEGDVFWNRILARRADTPSPQDYQALEKASPKLLVTGGAVLDDLGRGALVNDLIGMRGQAALGVLGAFFLFLIYWTLAGPGGHALLAWRHWQRHSWLAFTLCAVVFGVGVWAIGGTVSSTQCRGQHLTVIDSIRRSAGDEQKGEPVLERAVAWFSAYLPGYRDATIAIESTKEQPNVLTSWSPPPLGGGGEFPNPAIARVEAQSPGSITVAARATSASFEANWIGALNSSWGRLPFASDPTRPLKQSVMTGDPIRVSLSGVIEHRLPGTLRNVHLIHISPLRNALPTRPSRGLPITSGSDSLPNEGRFAILAEWPAGTPIEIGQSLYPGGALDSQEIVGDLADGIRSRYYNPFANDVYRLRIDSLLTRDRVEMALDMLGIYSMLQPPDYIIVPPTDPEPVRVQRMLGRSLDLSPWFTRPCLIVWGYLDTTTCPVPIRVNGEEIPTEGFVVVRTVFPLPVEPEMAAPEAR